MFALHRGRDTGLRQAHRWLAVDMSTHNWSGSEVMTWHDMLTLQHIHDMFDMLQATCLSCEKGTLCSAYFFCSSQTSTT